MTKAKLAALRQSQVIATRQRTNLDLSQIKSPKVRKFKVNAKTPYKKNIIVSSSSPTDFMNSPITQSNPTIITISKSPNSPNPRKRSADHTVRKLHVENMLTNLPITPTNDEPEIVDLIESSDNPTRPEISIQPPSTDFGQSCIILSSDSQDSVMSFHTAAPSIVPPEQEPKAQPAPTSTAQMSDMPGPSRAPTAQSTPIDNPGPSRAPSKHTISPIKQLPKKLLHRTPKKTATKNSSRKQPKQTKQATAQKKLTKAKLAALRQSQVFATRQRTSLDLSQIKSPKVRKFKVKAKTPYKKDHIIVSSSSPTDFMNSPITQSNSTIITISKSPNSPNPRKRSADHTVRKLHVENMLTNLPITTTNDEPEVVDLIESSDNPTRPEISIQPPSTDFGQSCIILSSDSQDSVMSFHTAAPSIVPPEQEPKAQPAPTSTAQMSDMPGPSRAPTAQSTPIDNPGPSRAPSKHTISPIKQLPKKLLHRTPKKTATKNSSRKQPKQTKQATAQKKLTKAKLAALRQSQVFATRQRTSLDLSQIKSPKVRKFKVKAKKTLQKRPHYRIFVVSHGLHVLAHYSK